MRAFRPGLELGMELAGDEPRMVLELDDLDEPAIRRLARQHHAGGFEHWAIPVVDLEPVAVALVDDLTAVHRRRLRPWRQPRGIQAETHRPALVLHLALIG